MNPTERHGLAATTRNPIRLSGIVLLAAWTAGCHPTGNDAPTEPETHRAAPVMELDGMNQGPLDEGAGNGPAGGTLDAATEAARADLAESLDLDPEDITVVERRAVTWRNGALGCPEPGMMYTQALVPGYWIRLATGGRNFDYHAARGQSPFRCPAERAETPLPPDEDPAV